MEDRYVGQMGQAGYDTPGGWSEYKASDGTLVCNFALINCWHRSYDPFYLAGHGGSAYKVFQKVWNSMEWVYDADENGQFIRGKHKSPVGKSIPLREFNGG